MNEAVEALACGSTWMGVQGRGVTGEETICKWSHGSEDLSRRARKAMGVRQKGI